MQPHVTAEIKVEPLPDGTYQLAVYVEGKRYHAVGGFTSLESATAAHADFTEMVKQLPGVAKAELH